MEQRKKLEQEPLELQLEQRLLLVLEWRERQQLLLALGLSADE